MQIAPLAPRGDLSHKFWQVRRRRPPRFDMRGIVEYAFLVHLTTRQASLEDVFVQLTGRHLREE